MQFSRVRQLPHATAVVASRHCWVIVFEKPEVIDKTGWSVHRHTTSHDAGMIDTADVTCTSDIWHACSTSAPFEATSLWQITIILLLFFIILHCEKLLMHWTVNCVSIEEWLDRDLYKTYQLWKIRRYVFGWGDITQPEVRGVKLLGRVVRSASFLAGVVLECNLAHRRSVAELCMLFKIKSNQMHPLSGALPLSYVPAHVTRGALVAHRHSFAPPRCRTSQYSRSFVILSVSLWNDLSDPVFDDVVLAGLKSRANAFLLTWSALYFVSPTVLSSSSFHGLVVWGWGLWTDRVFSLCPGLAQRTPNNNNEKIKNSKNPNL